MPDDKPKIVVPSHWPEHYKKDFIANRTHGPDNLRDNEMVVKGKVVAKPREPKKVDKSQCPICGDKDKNPDSFILEPGIKTHHCKKCGYWDEKEVKILFDKLEKKEAAN